MDANGILCDQTQAYPSMKIYVAGKYADKEQIHERVVELTRQGYNVTHDWTVVEQHDRSPSAFGAYAKWDIDAVRCCDIVVMLMEDPKYAYRGTFTELGAALALEKTVILMCPHEEASCKTNVFFHHPNITHVKDWNGVADQLVATTGRHWLKFDN